MCLDGLQIGITNEISYAVHYSGCITPTNLLFTVFQRGTLIPSPLIQGWAGLSPATEGMSGWEEQWWDPNLWSPKERPKIGYSEGGLGASLGSQSIITAIHSWHWAQFGPDSLLAGISQVFFQIHLQWRWTISLLIIHSWGLQIFQSSVIDTVEDCSRKGESLV